MCVGGGGDINVIKFPVLHCKQKCLCLIKILLLVEDGNYPMAEKQPGPTSSLRLAQTCAFSSTCIMILLIKKDAQLESFEISFISGQNEDCNLEDSTSDSSETAPKRRWGKGNT